MQAETAMARKMRFTTHNARATSDARYIGSFRQFKRKYWANTNGPDFKIILIKA